MKTLDFIMCQEINRENYPLSRNKEELLKKENVGVLANLLLVDNLLLTTEILEFIKRHLRSQYALY